jgi:hypothetical protein
MLKTIKIRSIVSNLDLITVDILADGNDFVLLWNNEGLYKIFPSACFLPTQDTRFVHVRWSDGYQIPVETARLLTGE